MRKIRILSGLPVLELRDGTELGKVKAIVLNGAWSAVAGLIVGKDGWFEQERALQFSDLSYLGRDAVTLRDAASITDIADAGWLPDSIRCDAVWDKPVFTETGMHLGVLADFWYEPSTGEVNGYQLSNGVFVDLLYGRPWVPLPQAQIVADDRLIVPEATLGLLQYE